MVYIPNSNSEFRRAKFEENVRRDQRQHDRLRNLGWQVITVWECKTKAPETLAERLKQKLPVTPE